MECVEPRSHWQARHFAARGGFVVRAARRPYPRHEGNGKFVVRGRLPDGTYAQVIYIFSPADVLYVIHARPLTEAERRRYRARDL